MIFHPFTKAIFSHSLTCDRHNHPCQISSLLLKGFGVTSVGSQILRFPLTFDCRPYNIFTHYCATL